MTKIAIELKGITKTFGSVVANKDVNIKLEQGEIIALLGENGSGKTTLMNMLSGIYQPDLGSIYVNGEKVAIHSPEDSKRLGIGMVHQHFKLVEVFTAADNILMGVDKINFGIMSKLKNLFSQKSEKISTKDKFLFGIKKTVKFFSLLFDALLFNAKQQFLSDKRHKEIESICKKFDFNLDLTKKIYDMSVSEKQTLEIIKVLYYGAKVIILDEPTAVLTAQEIKKLFDVLRRMRSEGHAIIIITHKLNEVLEISDRVTILRKGEFITTLKTNQTNEQELTEYMVGRKVDLKIDRPPIKFDKPLLEIRNLYIKNDEGSNAINDVSFYIRGGEILGVAGIAGCGQKELCEAIAGLRPVSSGQISHKGENIIGLKPKEIIQKGISMSFIPEDRLGMGLAPSLSVTDNMMLKSYANNKWYNPFVDRKSARALAKKIIDELGIVTPSTETPVRRLSGGNVQKVLVGREIQSGPNVIVTAYPVRGLDINSSYAIYDILNAQKKDGVGILYIGEDLDVMIELCDKILVLCNGKVMGIVHAHKTSKEELGLMMTGTRNLLEIKKEKKLGFPEDKTLSGGSKIGESNY